MLSLRPPFRPIDSNNNITLRFFRRLLGTLMHLLRLKRDQIANFLALTLIILTISVAGAGYITYKNLEKVVASLETEAQPNNNLLLYKEILIGLNAMENQVESYQLTENIEYLDAYNDNRSAISLFLDSIAETNIADPELLVYNDSLSILIDKKIGVLDELLQLTPDNPNSNLSNLEAKLNEVTEIVTRENPGLHLESKKGFLKRLFNNEEEETGAIRNDSVLLARVHRYQQELNQEIARIKRSMAMRAQQKRNRQMDLEAAHFEVQNRILDLINFLESRESFKLKINTLNAQDLASRTNRQIVIFSSLATALLIMSLFIMFNYVSKSRKYQNLLRESKRSAETLAKAKERFFANMSHEIRTPMNAISGFTKILLRSDLDRDQKEQVEIINKSSEHLIKLLNDILDFSKLQAEKLQLESSIFELRQVCLDSIQMLQEGADKKGLELEFECRDLPQFLIGDPHRLRQILLNILGNSIKYTESGTITLEVTCKKQKDQKVLVQLVVSDTGIGISGDQQVSLFREFEQANQSSFSKGTGLGLAITKRLVMLHHGEIELKSEEGKGTTVRISIPYKISPKAPADIKTSTIADNLGEVRVLIADDEPFNVKLLATLLSKHGIRHDEAYDGKRAHELLLEQAYDVVLLDLKMPEMSGWQIVQSIKNQPGPNREKPFIALTATITKLDQEKGHEVGFDSIMRKPFDENKLFEFIGRHARIKTPVPESAKVDLSSLNSMGDKDFVEDMVETFISSASDGMTAIKAGFETSDFDHLALTAHRIVAPARHFKATSLVRLLKELQHLAEKDPSTITNRMITDIESELNAVIQSLRKYLEKEITN